jgi:hypothetical protein
MAALPPIVSPTVLVSSALPPPRIRKLDQIDYIQILSFLDRESQDAAKLVFRRVFAPIHTRDLVDVTGIVDYADAKRYRYQFEVPLVAMSDIVYRSVFGGKLETSPSMMDLLTRNPISKREINLVNGGAFKYGIKQADFIAFSRQSAGIFPNVNILTIEIPRPSISRQKGKESEPYLIEDRDIENIGKVCPNVKLLRVYNAKNNQLSTLLKNFNHVEELEFEECDFILDDLLKLLKEMPNLKSVRRSTSNCEQTTEFFSKLNALREDKVLTEVEFGLCFASDDQFKELANVGRLKSVTLGGCHRMTSKSLEYLATEHLESLSVGNCGDIESSKYSVLAKAKNLTSLTLGIIPFGQSLDLVLQCLPALPSLKSLTLTSRNISMDKEGFMAIASCPYLSKLEFLCDLNYDCQWSDEHLLLLAKSKSLKSITLPRNSFTTAGVIEFLLRSPQVKTLDIRKAPHLKLEEIEKALLKKGRKINIMGSKFEQMQELLGIFEKNEEGKMKAFAALPADQKAKIYENAQEVLSIPKAETENVKQYGKFFGEYAFHGNKVLDKKYHLSPSQQFKAIYRCYLVKTR